MLIVGGQEASKPAAHPAFPRRRNSIVLRSVNAVGRKILSTIAPFEGRRYRIGVALFLRGLAGIYLVAIVSWWVQFSGLVGGDGLVPMADYLEAVDAHYSGLDRSSFWNLPTLFWLSSADGFVHCVLALGVALAVLALIGYAQGPAFLGLWIIYLSVFHTGGVFLSFQWDILLVESGFLAIVAAPWSRPWRRSGWRNMPPPVSRVAVWLLWLLIARLMFFSGWVKIAWGDPSWWGEWHAMTFHYETQPLPTWTAWWMHQLPDGFQKFTLLPMYVIEIVLPFAIFCGTRLRLVSALGIGGLMVLIAATGNYTFFNLLTALLCLPLIEDRYWKMRPIAWLLKRARADVDHTAEEKGGGVSPVCYGNAWRWSLAAVILVLSVISIDAQFASAPPREGESPEPILPDFAHQFADVLRPFVLVNNYGLFRTMTRERPEVVIEGSIDRGLSWQEYPLKWKPGALDVRPQFVAPHQPRLAWQFWFLALEVRGGRISGGNGQWLQVLVNRLLANDPVVMRFFESHPFEGKVPDAVRANLYLYRFTDQKQRAESGNWWRREPVGVFFQRNRT